MVILLLNNFRSSQVSFFMNAWYSSYVTSFHLFMSSFWRTYCHAIGSSIVMTQTKLRNVNGALSILEYLLIRMLGMVMT
jgi:hypothetical protein